MRNRLIPALIALALSALLPSSGEAQTLRLQQAGSGGSSDRATVQVGQTITIEVFDLSQAQIDFSLMRPGASTASFQLGNAMNIPNADDFFDVVAMALVLFLVPEPK